MAVAETRQFRVLDQERPRLLGRRVPDPCQMQRETTVTGRPQLTQMQANLGRCEVADEPETTS